jgi:hypothetical protein
VFAGTIYIPDGVVLVEGAKFVSAAGGVPFVSALAGVALVSIVGLVAVVVVLVSAAAGALVDMSVVVPVSALRLQPVRMRGRAVTARTRGVMRRSDFISVVFEVEGYCRGLRLRTRLREKNGSQHAREFPPRKSFVGWNRLGETYWTA